MPHKENRKIIKVGETSYAVILPKSWLRFHKLDNNDHVQVVSDGSVVIKPLKKAKGKSDAMLNCNSKEAKKMSNIENAAPHAQITQDQQSQQHVRGSS